MENRFCFVAVVKNESRVIKRCLDSIANIATSYLICDTGSTDDTPKIIEEYMKEKNIPGEVIYKEWKNYGYNKSYLLDQAYTQNKSKNAKYLIWHDADEVFLTDPNNTQSYLTKEDANNFYDWLEKTSEPVIYVMTHYGNLRYKRWNIVRNNQLYKWISPKHEWLLGTVDNRIKFYDKFILLARQEGNASRDPERCQKDVKLFLDYINENGGFDKCPREVFYLAQEYESFDKEKAMHYYNMKVKMPIDNIQENYIAYLRLGRMSEKEEEKITYWNDGFKLIQHRLECIYEMMHYYKDKNWSTCFIFGSLASESRKINENDLWVESNIYEFEFDLVYSLAAFYTQRYQLANDINQRNIIKNKNKSSQKVLLSNQNFIDKKISEMNLIKLLPLPQETNLVKLLSSEANLSGSIPPNNDVRPSIIIIDNFYKDPDAIREMALKQEFNIKGNYPGGRTKSFATEEMKRRFEIIIGKTITYWPEQYNGSFQYTTSQNSSWIHRDMTDYSGLIFLSKQPPPNSGTVIYKHKRLNKIYADNKDDEAAMSNDSRNYDAWEIMDVIGNRYNRCILFDGWMSHCSNEYFGNDMYDGRLFQTFFFNTTK